MTSGALYCTLHQFLVENKEHLKSQDIDIPNITKIYIGLLLGAGFVYRGLIKPMMNKTPPKELLPHRWFFVGIVGLSMDIAKVPGTIIGAFVGRLQQFTVFRDSSADK